MAGPASSDVPDRYDVVFSLNDGTTYGFLFADSVESNLPFRTHKALYSYSPTFLERQNVSNTYGDNFQDFFLTGTQADFSEGEGQKFFRVNDPDSVRKYWTGLSVDPTTIPGNVILAPSLASTTTSVTMTAMCPNNVSQGSTGVSWWMADATNLYSVGQDGTVTTIGAHGAGTPTDICQDTTGYVYISSTTGVYKYNQSTFTTFHTGRVDQVVFANNILYGYVATSDQFVSFDTSGVATAQFTWKGADGTTQTGGKPWVTMFAYGGDIYIVRRNKRVELWKYDGSGVSTLAEFPDDFSINNLNKYACCVSQGIVFLSGFTHVSTSPTLAYRPQIYFYSNGSVGKLWESKATGAINGQGVCAPFGNGIVFNNNLDNSILQYDLAVGGVHTIANPGVISTFLLPSEVASAIILAHNPTSYIYGYNSNYTASGYIETSQYDFDNTLQKVFRGIKIEADIPASTSVDLAYQLDGAGGAYTSLQTGAVSGTEYFLPNNTTGSSISVKVTLNSATGANTPTLKHVYVRAAPTLQQFRKREYLFDLASGTRDEVGKTGRRSRDGTVYPVDAITACNNLAKIATQTIPFTIYDRFTTAGMTVLADLQENQAGYDGFAIYEVRPNVFIGRINLREV